MIEPTQADIGRRVIYTMPHGEMTTGVISSWNDEWVFVRYTSGDTAAATPREALEYEDENGKET